MTDTHSSNVLNRTMNINVYLPSSYSTNTTQSYPVLYLLHGMWGTHKDWQNIGMQSIVDNAGGKEMVIIMPDGFDSFYVNGYQNEINYETYMYTELIPYIESKYRIDTVNGKNRAIAGLSMGGFGAAYHGFKYPDMFSSVYAMSGAFSVTGNIISVVDKNNYPYFIMECGTEDNLVIQMNENFHNELQRLGVEHEYIRRRGTHSWDFWKECLPKAIAFVSNNFITPSEGILGDVNNDGDINIADYSLIRKHILGIENVSSNADVNADDIINVIDYSYVRKYILKIINSFPGE